MPSKGASFNKKTFQKNIKFLSLAIPIIITIWLTQSLFNNYMDPENFMTLPSHIREEHITSLFFRADTWSFPLSIANNFSSPIPLSLTDNIPIMALIFKVLSIPTQHYFGFWIMFSFILYTFFAYRICKNVFSDRYISIGLGTIIFITQPFIWYHTLYVPWLAGQWLILWAYSIYFKKKDYTSNEWLGILIISAGVHPFFAFITFLLMLTDIIHLYIYNHSISSVQAATTFSYLLTTFFVTMSIMGVFYLPSFLDSNTFILPISFNNYTLEPYNISYLKISIGAFLGLIVSFILYFFYEKTLKLNIYYYKALIGVLFIFFFCASLGGIQFTENFIFQFPIGDWGKQYLYPFITSGPKLFLPILYLIPIVIVSTAAQLNEKKYLLGTAFLFVIITLDIIQTVEFPTFDVPQFQELDTKTVDFIQEADQLEYVFLDILPYRPPYYERFAYFAYANDIALNAAPLIRFPTGYKDKAQQTKENFLMKKFNNNSVYIISKELFPQEYHQLGNTHEIDNIILFKVF